MTPTNSRDDLLVLEESDHAGTCHHVVKCAYTVTATNSITINFNPGYYPRDFKLARTKAAYRRWRKSSVLQRGEDPEKMAREKKPPKRLQGQFGSRKLMSPVKKRDKKKIHPNQVRRKSARNFENSRCLRKKK